MKNRILLSAVLFILALPGFLLSQCYTVLSVKGEIILEKTGKPIQEMDEICATDKLTFKSSDSKAAVLSSEQGRFILKPGKSKKNESFSAFVKSVLSQGTGSLSTRGEVSLENEFGESYFVIGTYRLPVDIKTYPMSESNFFYIKYKYNGEDINKKLKFNKDTLFIDKESVFKIDEIEIDQKSVQGVSLYYFEKGKNTSTKIASFQLSFANESKLTAELKSYVNLLKNAGKNNDYIIQEVVLYLNDVYGNINIDNLKIWLFDKYGLM
ncbi:MAG: hypothetical protein HY959_10105 [Ignavibacteriae bacterium]|nr:hypothetical protein [Ignavibacteriota bacterium]